MKKYDVIIVGCGPAGIGAAKTLEKSNLTYCVIEKNKFPRFKLCGGGLTIKSQRALKKLQLKVTDESFKCSKVLIKAKNVCEEIALDNDILMLDRIQFDYDNLKQLNCNDIFENETITKIENNILETDKDSYEFKYIIFADGVNGYSRRLISDRNLAFSVEYESPKVSDRVVLDFASVKEGCCWIFPKKNSTVIGLGDLGNNKVDYVNLLVKFSEENGFEVDRSKIKGYHLPIYSRDIYLKSVVENKYILVGDAASLVDPVSGEGIYYALMSGHYAAESIIEALKSNENLSEIYFKKTDNLAKSLDKRKDLSKLLYSRFGSKFIKLGLTPKFIDKVKKLFG